MKQTLEKAKQEYIEKHVSRNEYASFGEAFIAGAEWKKNKAIEVLSSVLENWMHGGDADCIIAEFEEKLGDQI